MNAPRRLGWSWDVVRQQHYIMTPEDFADGCFIRTCADTGRQWGTGEHRGGGGSVTAALHVPLCIGCDQPIPDDGGCTNCAMFHADVADDAALRQQIERDLAFTMQMQREGAPA